MVHANFIYPNQSETVFIPTMGGYVVGSSTSRTNCPHVAADLKSFGTLFPNLNHLGNVIIASGNSVLLKAADISSLSSSFYLNRITVQSGASLIFDDAYMKLHVREIVVAVAGSFLMGSETCRLNSKIEVIFYGTKLDSSVIDSSTGMTSKGLVSYGTVSIHGIQFHPTWTRLATTATMKSNILYLQDRVNWEVGQSILVTPTVFFDCSPVY